MHQSKLFFSLSTLFFIIFTSNLFAGTSTTGEDKLYAVKSTGGSTQSFGTVDPTDGSFTSIKTTISPTGLGWPLGDIGSQPDPINGLIFTRQTNSGNEDIMAIKKSDGSTSWLGLNTNDLVVGFDSKLNRLIFRRSVTNTNNKLMAYNMSDNTTSTILSSFGGTDTSWQAGGIGVVDSFNRKIFQLRTSGAEEKKLYIIDADNGSISSMQLSGNGFVTIAFDSKEQKLYGLQSDGSGAYDIVHINYDNSTQTQLTISGAFGGMSNYVQVIAPNDQRYYVQEGGSTIRAVSLADGSSIGTFTAPLRLFPVCDVIVGTNDNSSETITHTINDPVSNVVKRGWGYTNYIGRNYSYGYTRIMYGRMAINNLFENSRVRVYSGATLEGTGTVGGITNDDNGTVAPGNSIGTLNVSGDVSLGVNSILVIEVDNTGNTDKIIATGSASVNGKLRINPAAGSYGSTTFTFLTANSVTGTFSDVTVLSCTGTANVTYGSTSISFVLSNCSTAETNLSKITSYINDLSGSATGDLNTVITEINGLTGTDYNKAVNSLDFNNIGVGNSISTQVMGTTSNFVNQRVTALNFDITPREFQIASASNTGIKSDANNDIGYILSSMKTKGSWGQMYGGSGSHNPISDIGINGYGHDYVGSVFGYDRFIDRQTIRGYGFSFQQGETVTNDTEGDSDYNTYSISPYQSKKLDNGNQLTYQASLSATNIDSKRYLRFGAINRTATSDYTVYGLGANVDYTLPTFNHLSGKVDTRLKGGYNMAMQEGFTEKGADSLNLKVSNKTYHIGNIGLSETLSCAPTIDRFITAGE